MSVNTRTLDALPWVVEGDNQSQSRKQLAKAIINTTCYMTPCFAPVPEHGLASSCRIHKKSYNMQDPLQDGKVVNATRAHTDMYSGPKTHLA